jgi:hypothetical protein
VVEIIIGDNLEHREAGSRASQIESMKVTIISLLLLGVEKAIDLVDPFDLFRLRKAPFVRNQKPNKHIGMQHAWEIVFTACTAFKFN